MGGLHLPQKGIKGIKMKNSFIVFGFLSLLPVVSFAYIPSDLEKLNHSDNCQKCDITEYVSSKTQQDHFTAINLNQSYWTAAVLKKVDFRKKSLIHSNFVVSKMFETIFDDSDLSHSNLSNSECENCSFKNAKLKNSIFYKAKYENAQFTNADLSNSNLEKANFLRAEFMNVNFSGANLSGAELFRANLYGSNITQEQLDSLSFYRCAILPDGTVNDENGEVDCD